MLDIQKIIIKCKKCGEKFSHYTRHSDRKNKKELCFYCNYKRFNLRQRSYNEKKRLSIGC